MDKTVLSTSFQDLEKDFEFKKKDMIWITDTNYSGSYNNAQVTFDLSSLCNNTSYAHFKEGYITIPLVMNLSSANAGAPGFLADASNAFCMSLKKSIGCQCR